MLMSGFPEECLREETSMDLTTASECVKLDAITSLLAYVLYPNVCYHTDRRKLLTHEGKVAIIHKNSVNCGYEIPTFRSPFFVFAEKIKTRVVSAKSMTMVTPAQLIVFSADKVELTNSQSGDVCLDSWVNLKIDPNQAALLASLRLALERIMAICTTNPETVTNCPRHILLFSQCVHEIADVNGQWVRVYKGSNKIFT